MNADEIQALADTLSKQYGQAVEVVQTHGSWVLLGEQFAYKVKKPVLYSFMDFSTLEKRKAILEQELELNRRLAAKLYLGVEPITKNRELWNIGGADGEIQDYTLKMRRVDENRQMNRLLDAGAVSARQIEQIVDQLVLFHQSVEVIKGRTSPKQHIRKFSDLEGVLPFVEEQLGRASKIELEQVIETATGFVEEQARRFLERDAQGMVVDAHGDLHSMNIFLLEEPIIFDCIEFNDEFRQIDILNDIAFFCMDMDAHGRPDFGQLFLDRYLPRVNVIQNRQDELIFLFFKMYRANVRLKVNALKGITVPEAAPGVVPAVQAYFNLLMEYHKDLQLQRKTLS